MTNNTPTAEDKLIHSIGLAAIAIVTEEAGRPLTEAEAKRAVELGIAHAFNLVPEVRQIIASRVWDAIHA